MPGTLLLLYFLCSYCSLPFCYKTDKDSLILFIYVDFCPEYLSYSRLAFDLVCFSTIVLFLSLCDLFSIDWFPFPSLFTLLLFDIYLSCDCFLVFISPSVLYISPCENIPLSINLCSKSFPLSGTFRLPNSKNLVPFFTVPYLSYLAVYL